MNNKNKRLHTMLRDTMKITWVWDWLTDGLNEDPHLHRCHHHIVYGDHHNDNDDDKDDEDGKCLCLGLCVWLQLLKCNIGDVLCGHIESEGFHLLFILVFF